MYVHVCCAGGLLTLLRLVSQHCSLQALSLSRLLGVVRAPCLSREGKLSTPKRGCWTRGPPHRAVAGLFGERVRETESPGPHRQGSGLRCLWGTPPS